MEETSTPAADKRSIGLKYGLISSVLGIVFFVILAFTLDNPLGSKLGLLGMVISVVLLVLAHKAYKEEGTGFMTYGEGVSVGFWFTLVGIVVGVLFNYVFINFINPNLMDYFVEGQRAEMEAKGLGDEQIDMALGWTARLYWPMAIIGGFMGSMVLVLIVTIFTQKKRPEERF